MRDNIKNILMKYKHFKLIIVIIVLLVLVLGGTFAYFAFSANNGIFGGNMANVNLDLTVTKILPITNGVDDVIVTNFSDLAESLNDGCTFDKDFASCQLYKVHLENNSNGLNANLKGSLSFDNKTAPNLSWISVDNYSSSITYTDAILGSNFNAANSNFTSFVDNYLLTSGSEANFYILVWVNETEDVQTDEATYTGTVRFEDANGKGVTATFNS